MGKRKASSLLTEEGAGPKGSQHFADSKQPAQAREHDVIEQQLGQILLDILSKRRRRPHADLQRLPGVLSLKSASGSTSAAKSQHEQQGAAATKKKAKTQLSALKGDQDWRSLMEPTRRAARKLCDDGVLQATQKGQVVDVHTLKGPFRLRFKQ